MKKALLIVNPVSGKLKGKASLFAVLERLNANDVLPTVAMTRARGHATELAAATTAADYDCVICCGGDGTLNETICGILQSGSGLPIGYIPAGTTNDFASGLGLPLDLADAAESIAKALHAGETIELDIGKFGDGRIFNYIASFGAFTTSSYATSQAAKNVLGHLAYVFAGVKDFFAIKPIHVRFNADGAEYEGDYVFGGVCNTYSVGGIVKLSRDSVDISDGLFELILVKAPKDMAEFNRIVNGVMTSRLNDDIFINIKAKKVDFEVPETLVWSLDGEQAALGSHISTENLNRAVRLLLIPKNA